MSRPAAFDELCGVAAPAFSLLAVRWLMRRPGNWISWLGLVGGVLWASSGLVHAQYPASILWERGLRHSSRGAPYEETSTPLPSLASAGEDPRSSLLASARQVP